MKQNTKDQIGVEVQLAARQGSKIPWMTKSMSQTCAYGKGNWISAIFFASWYSCTPIAISWNTLERIGAGIDSTPDLIASTMIPISH